jgi:hypothetical protein
METLVKLLSILLVVVCTVAGFAIRNAKSAGVVVLPYCPAGDKSYTRV